MNASIRAETENISGSSTTNNMAVSITFKTCTCLLCSFRGVCHKPRYQRNKTTTTTKQSKQQKQKRPKQQQNKIKPNNQERQNPKSGPNHSILQYKICTYLTECICTFCVCVVVLCVSLSVFFFLVCTS